MDFIRRLLQFDKYEMSARVSPYICPLLAKGSSSIIQRGVFGDGPRNFEPWSSDVDDICELAPPSNFHITTTGGRLSLDIFIAHRSCLWYYARNHDIPATNQLP
ncbi:hypothetical protein TNCV_369441 [Trichonephila clavipes]|nr:hypothetical protein TNCV_369441 [Trichonephila clavipes]